MKNIHILSTDTTSKLFKDDFDKLFYSINIDQEQNHFIAQHIYITSDEEIKEGDWVYNNKENIVEQITSKTQLIFVLEENKENQTFKKIILTTNQDLIKDGVKWQQERMYSEEDLRQAFRDGQENINYSEIYGLDSKLTEQEWFEKLKKK